MRWRIITIAAISIAVFAAPAAHASVIQTPPNNIGLVGYWSFNEGTSSIAHDFSGHGNNGTLSGSTLPTWVAGKLGQALKFDGSSSSHVDVADITALRITGDVTISAWIKTTNINRFNFITSKEGAATGWSGAFPNFLIYQVTGILKLYRGNSSNAESSVSSLAALSPNVWYHVVGTISGNTASIYINGKLDNSGTLSVAPVDSGSDLYIGNRNYNTSSTWDFSGVIDDLRVYNRALSATEVAALYQSGAAKLNSSQSPGTLSSGLVGWWTMDGADTVWSSATAGVELDHSGNGNTGTLTNMNRATSPVIGKIAQALKFNGSSSYVNAGNGLDQTGATPFSIATWFKTSYSGNSTQTVVGKNNLSSPYNGYQFGFNIDAANAAGRGKVGLYLVVDGNGTNLMNRMTTSTWNDGKWHHAVATYDGSKNRNGISLYVDGVLQPMEDHESASITGSITNSTNFEIGARDGSGQPFNGQADDVRVYNRALSAAEVQQLYTLGAGMHANTSSANLQNGSTINSGLVGYWTFDGSTVTDKIYDLSGQGNNGYIGGGAATSSMKTIGKMGQALKFNGTSGYVQSTDNSGISGNVTATISVWVKSGSISAGSAIAGFGTAGTTLGGMSVYENVNGAGSVSVEFFGNNGARTASGIIGVGQWHHIVAIKTPGAINTTTKLYIDGVLQSFVSVSANTPNVTNGQFAVGRYPFPGNPGTGLGDFFNGAIDDVRIYNRALSAAEVQQLYNLGK